MLEQYEHILLEVTHSPEKRLNEISLMDEEARKQLLVDWNQTHIEYEAEDFVHEVFERQAAQHPNAVAVVFGGKEMSYGELNARANQLARRLRRLGVGPEVWVGLAIQRGFEMIRQFWPSPKPGGWTCRSTRRIQRSGSNTCWRTPRSLFC